ncbi:MAG: hypothetical protein WBN64_02220, partial [Candidatus Deferrimicrobium sp.]
KRRIRLIFRNQSSASSAVTLIPAASSTEILYGEVDAMQFLPVPCFHTPSAAKDPGPARQACEGLLRILLFFGCQFGDLYSRKRGVAALG